MTVSILLLTLTALIPLETGLFPSETDAQTRAPKTVDATTRALEAASEFKLTLPAAVTLLDIDGKERTLGSLRGKGVLVLAYNGVGCPIANKYAPRLERLAAKYASQGVAFRVINANPQDSRETMAKEALELGLTIPLYRDFRQELTRALDAQTTTETFVFDAGGTLRYRGAIDNQYNLGSARPAPTANWLEAGIEAALMKSAPATPYTEAPGCKLTRLSLAELPEAITWSKDISRIIQKNCESCHRPGQVGPFALQTYKQVKGWSEMILDVLEDERMPPWNAAHEFDGTFANERSLSKEDKQKLVAWLEGKMSRGKRSEDPEPIVWSEEWHIGKPDVIFTMDRRITRPGGRDLGPIDERGFEVPREGVVKYKHFTIKTNYPEDRWLQALECRPGAADVVHHILVTVDDPATRGRSRGAQIDYLAVAVPGDTSVIYAEGNAKRLPAGATLVMQLHYTPNGKQRFDKSSVGFIFADGPPDFEVRTTSVFTFNFRIPPGDANHEVKASMTLEEEYAVVSLFPHMHSRGKDFQFTAVYPDGNEELLLSVPRYDFNWQESYVFYDPLVLPKGTRIEVVGHFDNSKENPNNPDPTSSVTWGDQTFEEMFIGFMDFLVPRY